MAILDSPTVLQYLIPAVVTFSSNRHLRYVATFMPVAYSNAVDGVHATFSVATVMGPLAMGADRNVSLTVM